ncbi:aldo/keto reductase [Paenarthrobacter sp. NPDC089714]|uniref:aldo/keto reductase n=1 Tax=Paenarthrobacter sp. NPDC089714 TaxID=3364377 RepID=UPI003826D8DE
MKHSQLGNTDLMVSPLAFGTGPLGELFGPLTETDALKVVHDAIDLGINFIDTSPYYDSAEERLGKALVGRRSEVVLGTKAGRYGVDDFDFSPARLRRSVENSLQLLRTDYVDILQLHDIEFVPLGPLFEDSYAELVKLRDEGKCRYIGMTGYPAATMARAMQETQLDVLLTYSHATLLDDTLERELAPIAAEQGVGLINAAAVALGLLTPHGSSIGSGHPATGPVRDAAAKMVAHAASRGADIAFIANQYAIQRSGCATTLIGTGKISHLRSAVNAIETEIDEQLLQELLELRPSVEERTWTSGLDENNTHAVTKENA